MKTLSELVGDWGGFERLVATLHETGEVEVQHDVQLVGSSGAPRQIDVVVRHRQGLYEHLIIVECKYWNTNVSRLHVDALATAVGDLKASRGVIFSTQGFQEGAVTAAAQFGIELFKVREPTAEEWGLPGRVIDIYLWTSQDSIGNVQIEEASYIGPPPGGPINLAMTLGEAGTHTRVMGRAESLETLLAAAARQAAATLRGPPRALADGVDCTWARRGRFGWAPEPPLRIPIGAGEVLVRKVDADVAVKVMQKRIIHDRAQKYAFVLAVEDCIRGGVSTASRETMAEVTRLLAAQAKSTDHSDAVQNGSFFDVWVKGQFPFSEVDGLATGQESLEVLQVVTDDPLLSD